MPFLTPGGNTKVSMKECAGRGDRTRGRLHAKQARFRSSYRARRTGCSHPLAYPFAPHGSATGGNVYVIFSRKYLQPL